MCGLKYCFWLCVNTRMWSSVLVPTPVLQASSKVLLKHHWIPKNIGMTSDRRCVLIISICNFTNTSSITRGHGIMLTYNKHYTALILCLQLLWCWRMCWFNLKFQDVGLTRRVSQSPIEMYTHIEHWVFFFFFQENQWCVWSNCVSIYGIWFLCYRINYFLQRKTVAFVFFF